MSSHGIKLLGLIESLWYLKTASGGPSQAAKSTSQTSIASSINRPFPQNINYPGFIRPNYITQTAINNSIKSYYYYWKSTYVRKSKGGYFGWGSKTRNVLIGVAFRAKAPRNGGHTWA